MRRPAYMPTPVPTMLAMNAVMIPTRAPSHQPTALPRLAPRNVNSLDTAPYLLTHPACRPAAVPVNEGRVGENEARSLRAVRGQAEESHDGDKQQENGKQEIQRPHAGRDDLVHRLHDAYLGEAASVDVRDELRP